MSAKSVRQPDTFPNLCRRGGRKALRQSPVPAIARCRRAINNAALMAAHGAVGPMSSCWSRSAGDHCTNIRLKRNGQRESRCQRHRRNVHHFPVSFAGLSLPDRRSDAHLRRKNCRSVRSLRIANPRTSANANHTLIFSSRVPPWIAGPDARFAGLHLLSNVTYAPPKAVSIEACLTGTRLRLARLDATAARNFLPLRTGVRIPRG